MYRAGFTRTQLCVYIACVCMHNVKLCYACFVNTSKVKSRGRLYNVFHVIAALVVKVACGEPMDSLVGESILSNKAVAVVSCHTLHLTSRDFYLEEHFICSIIPEKVYSIVTVVVELHLNRVVVGRRAFGILGLVLVRLGAVPYPNICGELHALNNRAAAVQAVWVNGTVFSLAVEKYSSAAASWGTKGCRGCVTRPASIPLSNVSRGLHSSVMHNLFTIVALMSSRKRENSVSAFFDI
mmetsp:Transcript_20942/g.41057  ORF Transcript_20942/g.41057 Transcript_20942/m.41057 type:complete len:239 (+) Transcript_20942:172-888(+)